MKVRNLILSAGFPLAVAAFLFVTQPGERESGDPLPPRPVPDRAAPAAAAHVAVPAPLEPIGAPRTLPESLPGKVEGVALWKSTHRA